MLTTKLILEKLDREGKLLERREQPSRSFVLQFIDMLYSKHAQVNRAMKDITNTSRTLDYAAPENRQLMVTSTTGHASFGKPSYGTENIEGQDIGIQVGRGDTAPTPTDYKMEDRIKHSKCGEAGTPATFTNPSFETGDLTGWTEAHSGAMVGSVNNGAWALKDETWFCTLLTTGPFVAGDYAQVSQDIDLTNITHLRFQLRGEGGYISNKECLEVLIDGHPVYVKDLKNDTDYPNQLADVCAYTGTHTVTFKCIAFTPYNYADEGAFIDNIETLNIVELEYGGTEISLPIFGALDHNGEFTIRRYFTNSSDSSVTINEVGIYAMGIDTSRDCYPFLIARDVVSPGVEVTAGQMLRVTYVPQIKV